jgi:hypothetical protein
MLDQIFHPEQRVASISHHRVFLHSNETVMQIAEFRPHADLEATKPQALQGGLNPPRRAEKSKDRAVHRLQLVVVPNLFAERNLSKSLENAQESSARARL